MLAYIGRRLLLLVPTVLVIVSFIFFAVRILPGDPAVAALGHNASAEALASLRARWGLDRPLGVQYISFIASIARGDFGRSYSSGLPIASLLLSQLPYTLELTFAALLVAVVLGIPLGLMMATKRNSAFDHAGRILSLAGISMPTYYLGILLLMFFALRLHWFPVMGAGHGLEERLRHLVLPAFTLGAYLAAYVVRIVRTSMLREFSAEYVTTARAKGLPERVVLYKHAFRNAAIPLVTLLGVYTALLIGGTVLIEVVFNRPGLGKVMLGAIKERDYMALQSVMVIYGTFVVIVNLFTDVACAIIDPRIRYD